MGVCLSFVSMEVSKGERKHAGAWICVAVHGRIGGRCVVVISPPVFKVSCAIVFCCEISWRFVSLSPPIHVEEGLSMKPDRTFSQVSWRGAKCLKHGPPRGAMQCICLQGPTVMGRENCL